MSLVYYVNALRWRMARLFAPDPIIAEPLGDGQAFILYRPEQAPRFFVWIEAKTLDLEMNLDVPPFGDRLARANWSGPKGTFSGTI